MPLSALDKDTTNQRVEYVCPRCDGVVAEEDTVCPHCGQALEVVSAADQERPARVAIGTAVRGDYAGWWRRFLAWSVDWILLSAISLRLDHPVTATPAFGVMLIFFLYFAFLNGRGRTLGKVLFGISVVDAETHEPIGFGRGAAREAIRLLCFLLFFVPLLIDGLRPLWNAHHQSWHDSVASSIVVRRHA